MSEGGGGGGGGSNGNSQWENHSWAFSNSENSAGSDGKSGKKPVGSNSNSPTATATPAPDSSQKRCRNGSAKNSKGDEWKDCKGDSDHEIHIWTERERRKKMRHMFSSLHALLPQLPAKADKSTIVDEAVSYIRSLQHTLQNLQKQRLEMMRASSASMTVSPAVMVSESREAFLADQGSSERWGMMKWSHCLTTPCFQTWSSPNVVLCVSGEDAQISICTAKKPGLSQTIFFILEKYNLEVVTAQIVSDYFRTMFMIHAHASWASDQYSDTMTTEELYKLAVGEIILWLSS